MSDATDQYWLGRWVDEYEVTAPDQLRRLFALPGPMARLAELAKTAPNWNTSNPPVPGLSVAAGRGIDLSGYMSCSAYGCMRKAVDAAYAGIFHYFDYIVVEGASPRRVLQRLNTAPQNRRAELYYDIASDVSIILYLRKIGAYNYTVFREKPQAFCSKHMDHYAKKFKIQAYRNSKLLSRAVSRLCEEASFKTDWHKGVWSFWITHDFFPEPAYGSIARGKKRPPQPEEMANIVIHSYTGGSLADVVFADSVGAPLARSINATWIDTRRGISSSESDVALHLGLPILDGIKIKDLIRLREDEKPFFDKFRIALRAAVEEQIRLCDAAPPQVIARAVIREKVEPALNDIETCLKANQRKLARKAAASLAVGTAVTSAGLIGSLPLLVDTGVVAMAASLPHIYKFFDEYGNKVELNDMYFLWKAKKIASSGHSTPIVRACSGQHG